MNTKDEVFDKFQEFTALVEIHTRKKIKEIRLDNGGEYTSLTLFAGKMESRRR